MVINIKGTVVSTDDKWIYDLFGISAVCPADIEKALNAAKGQPVTVHINSGGGDVFAGVEIYSLLRAYTGEVTICIVGLCASIASVIACAGYCEISPAATVMIHNVSGCARGDYNAMDKASEMLQKMNETIVNAYLEKSKKSKEELLDLMNKETWLTAQEAIEAGLCNAIMQRKDSKITLYNSCANIIPQDVINKLKNQLVNGQLKGENRPEADKTELTMQLELLRMKEVL